MLPLSTHYYAADDSGGGVLIYLHRNEQAPMSPRRSWWHRTSRGIVIIGHWRLLLHHHYQPPFHGFPLCNIQRHQSFVFIIALTGCGVRNRSVYIPLENDDTLTLGFAWRTSWNEVIHY